MSRINIIRVSGISTTRVALLAASYIKARACHHTITTKLYVELKALSSGSSKCILDARSYQTAVLHLRRRISPTQAIFSYAGYTRARSVARVVTCSLLASLAESSVSRTARLGTPATRALALLDCRCPMKCHTTSSGIFGDFSINSCACNVEGSRGQVDTCSESCPYTHTIVGMFLPYARLPLDRMETNAGRK